MKEIVTLILFVITLPALLELALVTIGAVIPQKEKKGGGAQGSFAVIIPAHNEEGNLRATVESLKKCVSDFDIVVIADNCTDNTAQVTKDLGVQLLKRDDLSKKGKGYALDFAFTSLENYDYFLVIDADTEVEPGVIEEVQNLFGAGADAVQLPYTVKNVSESPRSALMELALTAFNVVRPKGRNGWRLSAGIVGNGFALSRTTLEKVGLIK